MNYESFAVAINGLAVIIALLALVTQIREQKLALQTDLLLRLSETMDSDRMRNWRRTGSQKLIQSQRPNNELDEVLGFLSMIGFLARRRAIDHELVYRSFSTWVVGYWMSAESYVITARQHTPHVWESLEWLARRQIAREKKEGYRTSMEDANKFLESESQLSG
jgi:hypothetical protein